MISRLIHIIFHLRKVLTANGKRRFWYSLYHIILMAIACGLFYYAYWFVSYNEIILETSGLGIYVGYIIAMIVAAIVGLYCVIEGVLAQVVTFVTSFIGIFIPKQHLFNFLAFLISGATVAVLGYVVYYIVMNTGLIA